ncbi:hypothetical protein QC764_400415 [Podospora pseudoanserina]|uniref:Uncharacterized protein n=1 Tax=Podospora pseudoanserina TaxID=2609844 RepID=A0ABR0I8C0_9PEZI|nr:hypothetical protein QC764_400415 [Podospora pseudoanserina]
MLIYVPSGKHVRPTTTWEASGSKILDPAGKRVRWASEEGGRAIEQIYKGWTQRFDEQLQQIHQARLVIAEEMYEAGDIKKSTIEELERVAGNINGLMKRLREAEKENDRLEALLDAYQRHPDARKRMNATVLKGNKTCIERIRKAIGALKQEYEIADRAFVKTQ